MEIFVFYLGVYCRYICKEDYCSNDNLIYDGTIYEDTLNGTYPYVFNLLNTESIDIVYNVATNLYYFTIL